MKHFQPPSSMLKWLGAAAFTAASLASGAAHAAEPRVGVSVSVGQPGFYGRVNIGDQPPPAVIYQQPVLIQQSPVAVYRRPIYLRVPPGHYQHWAQYCGRYSACGQPVYFVRYDERRAPRWVERRPPPPPPRHWDRHDRHDHHDHHDHGPRGHRH